MKSFRRAERGFTLIELMIVIAIVGLMATMAVPSYQDRVVRAQVKEGLSLATFAQEAVQAHFRAHHTMPRNNAEAGLPPPDQIVGNYVSGLQVEGGVMHLHFGNNANRHLAGKTLSVRPAVVKAYPQVPMAWVCAQAGVPAQMQVLGENHTDLPLHFLPLDCRPGPAPGPAD